MNRRIFIRDDDVWTLDKSFRFFFDLAIERSIPIVYAVIPGKMDAGLVRFLYRAKEKMPQLLDITQHGWMHKNYALDTSSKYEFGSVRTYELQEKDIQQGLKKMQMAFGKHFTSAFVPPYHGYDERTLRVLHEQGFQLFSAGINRLEIKKRFIEMPAQVSFSKYDEGLTCVHEAKQVITKVASVIREGRIAGVVTHHADFTNAQKRNELVRFFDCLAALRVKKDWNALLFSELLNSSRSKKMKEQG